MEPQDLTRLTNYEYSQWLYSQQQKHGNLKPDTEKGREVVIAAAYKKGLAVKKVRGLSAFSG